MSDNEQALLDAQAESAVINDRLKSQIIKHEKVKKDKHLNQRGIEDVQVQVRSIQETIRKIEQQIVQLSVQAGQRNSDLDALGAGLCFKKTSDLERALKAAEANLSSTAGDAQALVQTSRTIAYIDNLRSQREAVAEYENQVAKTSFDRETDRQDELDLKLAIAEEQKKIANLKLQERQYESAFSLIHVEEDLCTKSTAELLDKLMSLANRERELQIALRVKPDPPVTRRELLLAATSGNPRKRAKGDKGMRDWTGARMNSYSPHKGNDRPRDNFRRCSSFETLRHDKPGHDLFHSTSYESVPKYEERIIHTRVLATSPVSNGMGASSQNRNLVNKHRSTGSGNDVIHSKPVDERRMSGQVSEKREARLPAISALKPLPPSAPSIDDFHNSFKHLHVSTPPSTSRNLVKPISPPSSTRSSSSEGRAIANVWNSQGSFGLLECGNSYGVKWPQLEDDCWGGKPAHFASNVDSINYGGDQITYFGLAN
jgi:hypothetical protein